MPQGETKEVSPNGRRPSLVIATNAHLDAWPGSGRRSDQGGPQRAVLTGFRASCKRAMGSRRWRLRYRTQRSGHRVDVTPKGITGPRQSTPGATAFVCGQQSAAGPRRRSWANLGNRAPLLARSHSCSRRHGADECNGDHAMARPDAWFWRVTSPTPRPAARLRPAFASRRAHQADCRSGTAPSPSSV
jgi:hypothetical protein